MQKFPDNEFDNWIKNSLEEPHLEFDPEAWKQMEQKLDVAYLPFWTVWVNNVSLIFATTVIIYLLLFDVQYAISDDEKTIAVNLQEQSSIECAHSDFQDEVNNSSKTINILKKTAESEKSVNANGKLSTGNEQVDHLKKQAENNKDNKEPLLSKNDKKDSFDHFSKEEKPSNYTELSKREAFEMINVVPKPYVNYLFIPDPVKRSMGKKINKETSVQEKKSVSHPKLSFNILVSPDVSSVSLSNINGTGLNSGLAIEYYLSPRWRISTGVINSNKIYGVEAENGYGYSSPSQSKLESIDAVCSVLDIPINFRYNLLPAGRGGFFVSSGLSSYLMLQEDYEFNYKNYNTSYTKNISVKGENQHLFQIINLSVGYEKELGRRISIQGEPFLKIPFKYVGYGKVKLITTGAFLSVKYKLY